MKKTDKYAIGLIYDGKWSLYYGTEDAVTSILYKGNDGYGYFYDSVEEMNEGIVGFVNQLGSVVLYSVSDDARRFA